MPTALLSVSDKKGIVDFARGLRERDWRIISTGGTAATLRDAGVEVQGISEVTGMPEIMGGRVKTLHPAIHGGILARRSVGDDMEQLQEMEVQPIGLVAVNLYPFRETIARAGVALVEALEKVDIGGPTLLRAAAKNYPDVWPVSDPKDYDRVLEALDADDDARELRRELAGKVFSRTATYDAAVAGYLSGDGRPDDEAPEEMLWSLSRTRTLRYGENPDQAAALYRDAASAVGGLPALEQLGGKELSYNNFLDLDAGLTAVAPFVKGSEPACVVVKHATPSGVAVGRSAVGAFEKAHACDPMSAFGSTMVFSEPVSERAAEKLVELFVECVLAPDYAATAVEILRQKEKLRILRPGEGDGLLATPGHLRPGWDLRGVVGGVLVQQRAGPARPASFRDESGVQVVTRRQPDDEEWRELAFAWAAVQGVKSNAILLAREGASIGIGAGQMSRVDASKIAIRKAREAGHVLEGAVLASDAFFPFRDGVDAVAEEGIRAIVQPGGSIRDEEVVDAAEEHGLAMVFTGRRLFRH